MTTLARAMILGAVVSMVVGMAVRGASLKHSNLEPGHYQVKDIIHPLAPIGITQNVDPNTIVAGVSVACQNGATTDNGWWRLYDLDADHQLVEEFCTKNVDYGIETATGPQSITANVFCLDDGLPFLTVFLTLEGTNTQPQPDAELEFFNIEVPGCCIPETQSMAVELLSEDCLESGTCQQLFIGANDLGQTAPSYISAPDCGITEPTDLALIGFPDDHVIQIVFGHRGMGPDSSPTTSTTTGTPTTTGVPATTPSGVMLIFLVLLGASTLMMRYRATG